MPKKPLEAPSALTYDMIASWPGLHSHPALVTVLAQYEALTVDIVTTREQLERLDATIRDDEREMDMAIAHRQRLNENPLEEKRAARTKLTQDLQRFDRSAEILKREEQAVRAVVGQEIDTILRSALSPIVADALTHATGMVAVIERYDEISRIAARLGRTLPAFAEARDLHRMRQLRAYWQQRFF